MSDELAATIESLATKIESLDLNKKELAVLDAALGGADAAEVQGYKADVAGLGFGLPDLRGRITRGVASEDELVALFPSRNIVDNPKSG